MSDAAMDDQQEAYERLQAGDFQRVLVLAEKALSRDPDDVFFL
ncbi:MAG: hypothetical protein ACREAA_09750 [Candidatus Polarisedimenticolia bacterium]